MITLRIKKSREQKVSYQEIEKEIGSLENSINSDSDENKFAQLNEKKTLIGKP